MASIELNPYRPLLAMDDAAAEVRPVALYHRGKPLRNTGRARYVERRSDGRDIADVAVDCATAGSSGPTYAMPGAPSSRSSARRSRQACRPGSDSFAQRSPPDGDQGAGKVHLVGSVETGTADGAMVPTIPCGRIGQAGNDCRRQRHNFPHPAGLVSHLPLASALRSTSGIH
jgi:hypothetical protein